MSNLLIITVASMLTLTVLATPASAAMSILKFSAPKPTSAPLVSGSPVTVKGTAMANNATKTNCNVQFQTNQAGYLPVTPTGQAPSKYTNWTATSAPLKTGLNILEAQLQCFAPGHLNGPPTLTKHLTHNVTAFEAGQPLPTSATKAPTIPTPLSPK